MSEMFDGDVSSNILTAQDDPMGDIFEVEVSHERQYTADELRVMYDGWLERRDIDPATTPHLIMGKKEFDLFRSYPDDSLHIPRGIYEIPSDDQDGCQYVLIEVGRDEPSLPHDPKLVAVIDTDFGTVLGPKRIARDFQSTNSNPDGPVLPELPGGAYATVDIANILATSAQGLEKFAKKLMSGKTRDPFSDIYGDIGIRAGGLAEGQTDAYVWTKTPFTKSVELTIAFPSQYDSVSIVSGDLCEAPNGKPNMAQIVVPTEIFRIEGDDLAELQRVYRELYHEPNFALSEAQKRSRDETFNDYLAQQISRAVRENKAAKREREEEAYRRREPPQLRYRELPLR